MRQRREAKRRSHMIQTSVAPAPITTVIATHQAISMTTFIARSQNLPFLDYRSRSQLVPSLPLRLQRRSAEDSQVDDWPDGRCDMRRLAVGRRMGISIPLYLDLTATSNHRTGKYSTRLLEPA